MLNFITGQPGNGKTLFALYRIHEISLKDSRPVFYSGIPLREDGPLFASWSPLGDLKKQVEEYEEEGVKKFRFTLPPNAMVVMDEAQRVFPVRAQGSKVPPHVAAFETHRHQGLDFYLLTQAPKLVDAHLRSVAGYHFNLVRRMGIDKTNVYEWEQCESDPMSTAAKKTGRHSLWSFPKEVYGWYKSAEVHTVKRNYPWKYFIIFGVALTVVVAASGFVLSHLRGGVGVEEVEPVKAVAAADGPVQRPGGRNPWDVEYRSPRIDRFSRTAPMYDSLQRIVSQPKVTGCMALEFNDHRIECSCSTVQGNRVDMTTKECLRLVRDGWFDETANVESAKAENIRRLNARDSVVGDRDASGGEGSLGVVPPVGS